MVVQALGNGSFRLQSGETSLLVDPPSARLKADVTLRTTVPIEGNVAASAEITFPGEYEVKGLEIRAWALASEAAHNVLRSAYLVRWEDLSFAFLGHCSKAVEPELIQELGEPDVVFLPLDGAHALSLDQASRIVKQIEPHLVIMSSPKTTKEISKIFGQAVEPQGKIVFRRKDVMQEEGKVVLLASDAT